MSATAAIASRSHPPAALARRGRRREPLAAGGRRHQQLAGVEVALQVLEVAPQVARRLVAVLGPLLERALDHARERPRHVVAQLRDRPRRVLQYRGEDRQVRVALERPLAARHLVEQDAEREDVGAVVDRQPLRLLGRHVRDGPDDPPVLGDRLRLAGRAVALRRLVVAQLREAEVEHLDPAVGREHHVLGLEVAVQDPLPVGRRDRVRERDREGQEALEREPVLRDGLGERRSLDVLHRDEADALDILERVQDDDPGVAQLRHRPRLPLEPRELLLVGRHVPREDLEGDAPAELLVLGEVDLSHSARAERLHHAVRPERPADEAAVRLDLRHDEDYDALATPKDPARDKRSHVSDVPPEGRILAGRQRVRSAAA